MEATVRRVFGFTNQNGVQLRTALAGNVEKAVSGLNSPLIRIARLIWRTKIVTIVMKVII